MKQHDVSWPRHFMRSFDNFLLLSWKAKIWFTRKNSSIRPVSLVLLSDYITIIAAKSRPNFTEKWSAKQQFIPLIVCTTAFDQRIFFNPSISRSSPVWQVLNHNEMTSESTGEARGYHKSKGLGEH
jgi:hypothetical protein